MDIFAGLVVILLGVAFAALVVSPRTARSLDTFGAGFLPYRSAGWPQGVQEEEPVPWAWPSTREPQASGGVAGRNLDGAEIVELSGDTPGRNVVKLQPMNNETTWTHSRRP